MKLPTFDYKSARGLKANVFVDTGKACAIIAQDPHHFPRMSPESGTVRLVPVLGEKFFEPRAVQ